MQYCLTREHINPFLRAHINLESKLRVLEIGCGEAGVLKAFTEAGHQCTGVDYDQGRLDIARKFMEKECIAQQVEFIPKNVLNLEFGREIGQGYDLILVKDVIEHILEKELLLYIHLPFCNSVHIYQ